MFNEYSVLVAMAPRADAVLRSFRARYVLTPATEMPAHVTIYVPFLPGEEITQKVLDDLRALFAPVAPFDATFARIGRFERAGVLYLAPEPAAPFDALHALVQARYPQLRSRFTPYTMHLTVAQGQTTGRLDVVDSMFYQTHNADLPLRETIREIGLFVKHEGSWSPRATFPLGGAAK